MHVSSLATYETKATPYLKSASYSTFNALLSFRETISTTFESLASCSMLPLPLQTSSESNLISKSEFASYGLAEGEEEEEVCVFVVSNALSILYGYVRINVR